MKTHFKIIWKLSKYVALDCILDTIAFSALYLCFRLQLLLIWEQSQARQGAPETSSKMKKCVQNALRKRARRLIEPLNAQIASKTANMVPNGAQKAFKMCPNHIRKDSHIVFKNHACSHHYCFGFANSFYRFMCRATRSNFIHSIHSFNAQPNFKQNVFVAARAGKQTHFSRWGAFL